jgi:ribosome-associated translation inhibitor RaiA
MKTLANKTIVFLVFIFTATLTVRTTLALVPLIDPNLLKNKIQDLKVAPWVVKCTAVQSSAEKKLNKFEENKNKHLKIYIELTSRFSEKINRWEGLGSDTTKLKADLAVVKEKVAKFEVDFAAYKSKLEVIGDINCDNTATDYANAIKDAKNALKMVRKDVVDIKIYYWTQIREDILDLKKQIISNSEE